VRDQADPVCVCVCVCLLLQYLLQSCSRVCVCFFLLPVGSTKLFAWTKTIHSVCTAVLYSGPSRPLAVVEAPGDKKDDDAHEIDPVQHRVLLQCALVLRPHRYMCLLCLVCLSCLSCLSCLLCVLWVLCLHRLCRPWQAQLALLRITDLVAAPDVLVDGLDAGTCGPGQLGFEQLLARRLWLGSRQFGLVGTERKQAHAHARVQEGQRDHGAHSSIHVQARLLEGRQPQKLVGKHVPVIAEFYDHGKADDKPHDKRNNPGPQP
jgi:hypothetical protein